MPWFDSGGETLFPTAAANATTASNPQIYFRSGTLKPARGNIVFRLDLKYGAGDWSDKIDLGLPIIFERFNRDDRMHQCQHVWPDKLMK